MTGFDLFVQIGGGVALLLWATRLVRTGIERAYGQRLQQALTISVRNRVSALLAGLATAVCSKADVGDASLKFPALYVCLPPRTGRRKRPRPMSAIDPAQNIHSLDCLEHVTLHVYH